MTHRIDLLSAAVILAGATALAQPRTAQATYYNPWNPPTEGVIYCCSTPPTARCCSNTGCMSKDGMCLVAR